VAELAAILSSNPALLPSLDACWRCLITPTPDTDLQPTLESRAMLLSRVAAALVDVPGYLTKAFGSRDAHQQQQQQQLYALLVTCLKCCMRELKAQQQHYA
jgi:hypothetical protein